MSSKRGRKRNDNLPPNRARDVQRAFRARRAAHLEALEQRVAELEEENNALRAALSLPPANRPPLGKGPTGKDKPKNSSTSSMSALQSPLTSGTSIASLPSSSLPIPSTSRAHSPSSGSTRTGSGSPATMTVAYPASPHPSMEPATWDDQMFSMPAKEEPESSTSSTSQSYSSIPPAASPANHTSSYPAASRHSMPNLYTQQYSHSADRPIPSGGASGGYSSSPYMLRDVNPDRRVFAYQQTYPTHSGGMHSPTMSALPQSMSASGTLSAQPAQSYTHRRSITDPHGFRTALSHPPHITHSQHPAPQAPMRLASPSDAAQGADAPVAHCGGYQMSGERRGGRMH